MEFKPSENTTLYGMDFFFHSIIKLYNEKRMPNKILLSGKKGIGKSTLAYHLSNYILSQNEEFSYDLDSFTINHKNRSFKLLQNSSHSNFYLIDILNDKKNIDISQVREMISYTNRSTFNNRPRIILIDNLENLNINSVNALLKIIEEPNENIFFFLINNNEKKILPTLKSRCLEFKINFSFEETINITNNLLKIDVLKIVNNELINYYSSAGNIINLINFSYKKKIDLKDYDLIYFLKLIINNNYYKKNKPLKALLIDFIELFFLIKYKSTKSKTSFLNFYFKFMNKIHETEKFNLDDETLFLEFKSRLLNG